MRDQRLVAKGRLAVVAVVATALLAVLAVPAIGGPDAKVAKKALRTGKKALKSARAANKRATAGPRVTNIWRKVTVAPGRDGDVKIDCPAGYVVSGSSMVLGAIQPVSEAVAGSSVIYSGHNPSTTTSFTYTAIAICIKSSGATSAAAGLPSLRRQVAEAKRQHRAMHGG